MMNITKSPDTIHSIHPLIQKRWSPRAFSEKAISDEALGQLFEAARWAASAFNEQPWQYVYAKRGTKGFEQLLDCLVVGNQAWAKSAPVLMATMVKRNLSQTGQPNHWATHDLGLANAQLLLQAADLDIYGHMMAGFDKDKLVATLELNNSIQPVCMMALGYLGEAEQLEEPYLSKEVAPRNRKSITSFTKVL